MNKTKLNNNGIRLRCRLGWHNWSKWTTYSGIYVDTKTSFVRQHRYCLRCAKLQDELV